MKEGGESIPFTNHTIPFDALNYIKPTYYATVFSFYQKKKGK